MSDNGQQDTTMEHNRRSTDSTITRIEGEVQHLGEAYQGLDRRITHFETKVDSGFQAIQDSLTRQSRPNYMLLWTIVTGCLAILLVLGNMRVAPIETTHRADINALRRELDLKEKYRDHEIRLLREQVQGE